MADDGKKHLEETLWNSVEYLEKIAKNYFPSTPALPLDGNWIQTEFGTFHAHGRTAEFARAFKQQAKGVKLLPYFGKPNQPHEYVYVYYADETYPRGVIGFGRWGSVKDDGRERYTIVSRRIENNKFHKDKPQHLMLATEKLEVAVQNANAWLQPHTAFEIGKYFKRGMTVVQYESIYAAACQLKDARTRLLFGRGLSALNGENLERITNGLLSEVLPALDMYAEGRAERSEQDVQWHDALRKLAECKKLYEIASNRCKATWCVYVQVKNHNVVYKTARILHEEICGEWRIPVSAMWDDRKVVAENWFNDTDIADRQWVIGKLAVAETFSVGQYVPNIGYKHATNVFYIEELESDIKR